MGKTKLSIRGKESRKPRPPAKRYRRVAGAVERDALAIVYSEKGEMTFEVCYERPAKR